MTSRLPSELPGGYTPESWEYAKAFVGSLGKFPSTFTAVIRLLLTDHDKNPQALSEYGTFFVGRLLKSASIRAIYYHGIKDIRPFRLGDANAPFNQGQFTKSFNGYEHSVLLALTFLFRLSRKYCDPSVLALIVPRLGRSISMGWYVGDAIPAIGPGNAVLTSSFRVLGLIPFIKHEPKRFQEYWHHLHANQFSIDPEYEFAAWKCNSLQIAALLSQQLGFGLDRSVQLMKALTTNSPLLPQDEHERTFRVADVWFHTLIEGRSTPTVPLPPKYYPNKTALDRMVQRYQALIHNSSPHWILCTKADLSPQKTPQLFMGENPAMTLESDPAVDPDQVPEDMRESLPNETIQELSSKLLEDIMSSNEE